MPLTDGTGVCCKRPGFLGKRKMCSQKCWQTPRNLVLRPVENGSSMGFAGVWVFLHLKISK